MILDVSISAGTFVYQRESDNLNDGDFVGPTYHADQLWGNSFCQALTVGLASYHFESDLSGNHEAYISYESPRTSIWPTLANGQHVSEIGRVPFRNIEWNEETRTFKGKIKWQVDFGTTWLNESEWCYTITFDDTYSFVVSGFVESDTRSPQRFGQDLVYINAAIEGKLQQWKEDANSSTGAYLDILRNWRTSGASTSTLQMLGEVAVAVLN